MFAYNPGVNDRSGELIAQGAQNAAQINAQMMGDVGVNMGKMIASFAGTYAENKALEAKGKAYGEFLGQHGEQLGFNPEYLEELKKKKPRELAMIGDNIIGMQNTGNRLMGLNAMNHQANLYGGGQGSGGGGGAQPFFRMPGA